MAGRVRGKYVVWVAAAVIAALFAFVGVLAYTLTPAAERFHNRSVPTARE